MCDNSRYLTFALGKGRLADKTMDLLEKIGITCTEMKDKDSRKLIFVNEELKLKFFLAKGPSAGPFETPALNLILFNRLHNFFVDPS